MPGDDLSWRVEEACQNAWPSPRQIIFDGWLLRASGGSTRRTNSVSPLKPGTGDPTEIMTLAEQTYAALGQAAIFRVPTIAPNMEGPLDRRGYVAEGETHMLYAELCGSALRPCGTVKLASEPDEFWYKARTAITGASHQTARFFKAMVESIVLPKAFCACHAEDDIVAIAYGAIDRDLLVIQSVATHPKRRRQGYGSRTVTGLMQWALSRNVRRSCLQVETENTPARTFYRSLGYDTELYRYHYRRGVLQPDKIP